MRTAQCQSTLARHKSFLYRNQLQPVVWLDGSGAVKAQFVYGMRANVPEYMVVGTTSYRIITDQVGSVRLVVNSSTGVTAQRIDYDEFGIVLTDTSPGFQPFGFAGGLRDRDTGVLRFGARDYDPLTGRWLAKDPLRFGGGNSNLYVYCGTDPINCADPSGLFLPSGHHRILDLAFGRISAKDLATLEMASDVTDHLGATSTDPFYERMHAMTAPEQDPNDARAAYQAWVADSLNVAIMRERAGCHREALMALGMGMHAIMDSYFGPHEGFQTWKGVNGLHKFGAAWHGLEDLMSGDSRVRTRNAALEIQAYYLVFLQRSRQ